MPNDSSLGSWFRSVPTTTLAYPVDAVKRQVARSFASEKRLVPQIFDRRSRKLSFFSQQATLLTVMYALSPSQLSIEIKSKLIVYDSPTVSPSCFRYYTVLSLFQIL